MIKGKVPFFFIRKNQRKWATKARSDGTKKNPSPKSDKNKRADQNRDREVRIRTETVKISIGTARWRSKKQSRSDCSEEQRNLKSPFLIPTGTSRRARKLGLVPPAKTRHRSMVVLKHRGDGSRTEIDTRGRRTPVLRVGFTDRMFRALLRRDRWKRRLSIHGGNDHHCRQNIR